MSPVGVFLGGEGANELGGRTGHLSYQSKNSPGVIVTLLTRVQQRGWTVSGAVQWSKIRKYRATGPTPTEERNVLGLVDLAGPSHRIAMLTEKNRAKKRPGLDE